VGGGGHPAVAEALLLWIVPAEGSSESPCVTDLVRRQRSDVSRRQLLDADRVAVASYELDEKHVSIGKAVNDRAEVSHDEGPLGKVTGQNDDFHLFDHFAADHPSVRSLAPRALSRSR
jgi:hypothetical protein